MYKITKEEQSYLKNYDIAQFPRPSIAADMAVFSILEDENKNIRKLPKQNLKILLIRRNSFPYKGCWALPGGFGKPDEDIYETARRELYEETNVENAYLKLSGIYGDIGRDPRGWIISNTFLALIDGNLCKLRAGTDAWEARWFTVQVEEVTKKQESEEDYADLETTYQLSLTCEEVAETVSASICEKKEYKNYHERVSYELLDSEGLAFDHGKIILCSLLALRTEVRERATIVFDLMPELFTLTNLQKAFECILNETLTTPNFRRKIAEYVLETKEILEGSGHRPAKLFKRNVKAFYK